ncbi:MAG TPA: lytic murein transglycosylase B [Candidatus Competibacter sp.]|nr:lytic murein transglycosylase B [Candidatus Competibacter sp.]HUM94929.1 lytic murein transglycosylase B [Candidatus Competibacter sp.]
MKSPILLAFLLVLSACAPQAPVRQPGSFPMDSAPPAPAPQSFGDETGSAGSGQPLADRPDAQAFIRRMSAQHGFNAAHLQATFARAQLQPSIVAAMSKPAESKPWHTYRPIFMTAKRIDGGVAFWRANAAALARAEQVYGVPPEYVVAIIGVETQYGGNMGKYRVLEALATLAFDYPRRADYFRKELESFLLLTRTEGVDPLAPRGSYAGAMGYGQFMPSSYRSYAVDFDGDGHRDLWRNPRDAIGSVANYFSKHGWRAGGPVAAPASVSGANYPALVSRRLSPPQTSVASLRARGITPQGSVNDAQAALLLELQAGDGPEYWLGFHNFYVITRYNHSQLYAMAVYQLSQEIRARYRGAARLPAPQPAVSAG